MNAGEATQTYDATVVELQQQVEQRKERIIALLLQIDHIVLQENPRIEADYAVKVGYLVIESSKAELAMRRAKRKFALAQAAVNRGTTPDEEALEHTLNEEFEDWQAQLNRAMRHAIALINRQSARRSLHAADEKKFKTYYRARCKRLHPDLNPNQTEEEAQLFAIAQHAYSNGDLATLEALYTMVGEDTEETLPSTPEELSAELLCLDVQISSIEEQLNTLCDAFPYTMKDRLADPQWIASTTAELRKQIEQYKDATAEYTTHYKELLRDAGK